MKCQIKKTINCNFRIRELGDNNCGGCWLLIDIPEEIYEQIKNKLHGKPYTGIHREILKLKRTQEFPAEVILDYLYNNGFDYMFEEE